MNENILLVEDEEALRMTIGDRLRGEGYRVDFAADGNQGFDKATTLAFDLVILDVMLPYRNGFDVCRGVRQLGLATPILPDPSITRTCSSRWLGKRVLEPMDRRESRHDKRTRVLRNSHP